MGSSSKLSKLNSVLGEILHDKGTTIYRDRKPIERSPGSLRDSYQNSWSEMNIQKYTVNVSDRSISKYSKFFDELFEPFIDSHTGEIGISPIIKSSLIGKISITPVEFIRHYVLKAALFLGTEKTAQVLIKWIESEQIQISVKYHIGGIKVNSPVTFPQNLSYMKILPSQRENLDTKTSYWHKNKIEPDDGAILIVENQVGNMFFKPKSKEFSEIERNISNTLIGNKNFVEDFTECTTLLLNNNVTLLGWWIFNKELKPFYPIDRITRTSNKSGPCSNFKPPMLKDVFELMRNYSQIKSENFKLKTSLDRLFASKASSDEYVQFSNLRTAFDALFANEGRRSSGDRISLISAKLLHDKMKDKLKLYEFISTFYREASDILHGDQEDKKKKNRRSTDINKVEGVLCSAIMEILKANKIPDWNEFLLE